MENNEIRATENEELNAEVIEREEESGGGLGTAVVIGGALLAGVLLHKFVIEPLAARKKPKSCRCKAKIVKEKHEQDMSTEDVDEDVEPENLKDAE